MSCKKLLFRLNPGFFRYICVNLEIPMPERDEIHQQLRKITESEIFSRSGINVNLLLLLVKATLDKEKLKEAAIGTELFGKSYDPVKNDTKVRVYVHNLRKKLAAYYETEGKKDPIIFEIEKGQYWITFAERVRVKNHRKRNRRGIWIGITVLLITGLLAFLQTMQTTNFFWKPYSNSKFPTTVLIGDHFTIDGSIMTGGNGVFRDFNINSPSDFSDYIFAHPEKAGTMSPNQYPYITKMGPYCTKTITNFMVSEEIDFNLMLNSEWDKSMIGHENLVYIGQFKTMGFLKNVFFGKNPNFNISGSRIQYTNTKTGKRTEYISQPGDEIIDYTIVSQITGPEGNTISFFLSDNDIGVIRLVDYFTNHDSLQFFSEKYPVGNSGFTALFSVSGWERTGFKQKLILIEPKK